MLALALQLSVLFQMALRLSLEVNSRMSSAESMFEYTDHFPTEDQRTELDGSFPNPGAVVLKVVTFCYRTELAPVLKNITLKIEPGERVGIVGRTGSGKSSLFSALFNLGDELSGSIEINGINVKQL